MVEAVEGPSREPRYRLSVVPDRSSASPGEPTLAEFLAADLLDALADPKVNTVSPVAPTLQVLLTRMWEDARRRDRDRPTFDRSLYTALKARGFQLGEFLDQQLEVIAGSDPDAVRTGLVLDLLDFFTTALGTATTHTRARSSRRYPRQDATRLDALIRRCQDRYLLVEVRAGTGDDADYRLVHDTLAPLVRDRFQGSLGIGPAPVGSWRSAPWSGRAGSRGRRWTVTTWRSWRRPGTSCPPGPRTTSGSSASAGKSTAGDSGS